MGQKYKAVFFFKVKTNYGTYKMILLKKHQWIDELKLANFLNIIT